MTEIWPVNDADGAVIDVVFLHGLNGDGRKTWMRDVANPGSFWPQWLAEDVERVAVWTVHYDAWASRYLGHSMAIEDRAKSVMDQLRNKRLGERPLCFIAHSMGGLLVKEILMHSTRGRTDFRTFARVTRGVVFLATPHTGAAAATVLDALPRAVRQTPAVRDLRRDGPHLRQLSDDYRDWVAESGLKHKVYFEVRGRKGVLVVQPSSANPGLAGVASIPVDADHAAICKPLNRDSAVYAGVRLFVESLVTEVTRPPPADLPTFVPRPIHGRGETLDNIRASLARSVLVELSGTYGIGKTAIATQVAREAVSEAHVIYLSARGSPGVTVSSVLDALAASVDDPRERERLAGWLLAPDLDLLAKLDAVLDRLGTSRVLLIVDDAQELRASSGELRDNVVGELRDEALANLIRAIVRRPGHHVRFLLVTAEPLLKRAHPREPVLQGLTEEPFGEFIGDLEADGEVGLRMMPADEMRESLGGHPRTTELIFGIRSGSATSVRELVAIAGDPARLDRALMASLDDLDREALRALAVFGRPVLPAAVGELIGMPADVAGAALGRLCRRRIARRRNDRFDLPPDDAFRLTGQMAREELVGLRRRAAGYFEDAARCRTPRHVADLGDSFDAIDLHLLAGDAGRALILAEDLDEAHLKGWGQTGALTPWLVRVAGELTDPYDRVRNAALLARALAQQDDLGPAIAMTRTALDLNDALEIRGVQLRLLVQMAGYYFEGGYVRAAAEWYEEVLDLAEDGDPMVAEAHLGVAICRAETGDLSGALDALGEAAAAGSSEEPLTGARIGFARAAVACERDEYRRCRDLLQDAHAAAFDQNAYVLAGRCDNLRARIEWLRDDFDEARASALKALDAGGRTGHPGLSRAARVMLATLFLAHDPVRALEEATAATRFDRSPLVAEAFAVRGIALVRTDAGGDLAVEAFAEADRLASGLLAREPRRYLIREVQGLARAGLALLRPGSSDVPAEMAYRKAIPHPDVPGAWHRRRALFRTLVVGRPGVLPRLHDLLDGAGPLRASPEHAP